MSPPAQVPAFLQAGLLRSDFFTSAAARGFQLTPTNCRIFIEHKFKARNASLILLSIFNDTSQHTQGYIREDRTQFPLQNALLIFYKDFTAL